MLKCHKPYKKRKLPTNIPDKGRSQKEFNSKQKLREHTSCRLSKKCCRKFFKLKEETEEQRERLRQRSVKLVDKSNYANKFRMS
jgi:hypothetical protein